MHFREVLLASEWRMVWGEGTRIKESRASDPGIFVTDIDSSPQPDPRL